MKSVFVRRKHIDLNLALNAMSDPTVSRRDAVTMWRKAIRRADGPTKELLTSVAKLYPKKFRAKGPEAISAKPIRVSR